MTKPVIVTRAIKGAPLTRTELDNNFSNLDNASISIAGDSGTINGSLNDTFSIIGGTKITTHVVNNELVINSAMAIDGGSSATTSDGTEDGGVSTTVTNDVLFTGNYNDLTNKPSFATVATSGSYNDLSDKPSGGGALTSLTDTDIQSPTMFQGLVYSVPLGKWINGDIVKLVTGTSGRITVDTTIPRAPIIDLATVSGLTAGTYTTANVTVDSYGRVTSIANGSSGAGAPFLFVESGGLYPPNWYAQPDGPVQYSTVGGKQCLIWIPNTAATTISGAHQGSGDSSSKSGSNWGNNNQQAGFYLPAGIYHFSITGAMWSTSSSSAVGNLQLNWSSDWNNWDTGSYGSGLENSQSRPYISVFNGRGSENTTNGREGTDHAYINYTTVRSVNAGWWALSDDLAWNYVSAQVSIMVTKLG